MVVSYEEYGSVKTLPLKPGGDDIAVTNENREEYVQLYIKYLLEDSIAQQVQLACARRVASSQRVHRSAHACRRQQDCETALALHPEALTRHVHTVWGVCRGLPRGVWRAGAAHVYTGGAGAAHLWQPLSGFPRSRRSHFHGISHT